MSKATDVRRERKRKERMQEQIAQILAHELRVVRPADVPTAKNPADMVVSGERGDTLVRVRRPRYSVQFAQEFTLRAYNPYHDAEGRLLRHPPTELRRDPLGWAIANDRWSELAHVLEGYGDYYFYAITDDTDWRIIAYRLIDLQVFREAEANRILVAEERGRRPAAIRTLPNASPTDSTLAVFRYDAYPPELLRAQKGLLPAQAAML